MPVTDLEDQNVFVSYNFEANYNMPNVPNDSFPGPIKRIPGFLNQIQNVNVKADSDYTDVIARKLEEDLELEETTAIPAESEKAETVKRSLDEKEVFTRRGAYRLIENRLHA